MLAPGATLMVTRALRDSFGEVLDLLDEVLLKLGDEPRRQRLRAHRNAQPDGPALAAAAERMGLTDVQVTVDRWELLFRSGRELFYAPVIEQGPLPAWKAIVAPPTGTPGGDAAPHREAAAGGAGGVLGAEGHDGHVHRRPGLCLDRGRRPADRPQAGTTRSGEARMTLARYQELVAELAAHDRRYYLDNAPAISDQDYDRLYHELKAIEAAHPDWVVPESPTQRVAPAPVSAFPKIVREVPMLSLDNTYNPEELQAFLDRVRRGLHDETPAFVVEPKIDGISIELTYQQGRFVLGATRGDGRIGEEITSNLRTIRSLPRTLAKPVDVVVRGEVFMNKADFAAMNTERQSGRRGDLEEPAQRRRRVAEAAGSRARPPAGR